jgi:hypothetical protein
VLCTSSTPCVPHSWGSEPPVGGGMCLLRLTLSKRVRKGFYPSTTKLANVSEPTLEIQEKDSHPAIAGCERVGSCRKGTKVWEPLPEQLQLAQSLLT